MGFEVVFNHIYKYPLDLVIQTHFAKYPSKKMDVLDVRNEEHSYDSKAGVHYWRRVMVCKNILPSIFRTWIQPLNVESILLEEQCWYNKETEVLEIRSKNVTWSKYAQAWEESYLQRSKESSQWTVLSQRGGLDVKVFGGFGRVVELFLHRIAKQNGLRAIKHMDELLTEKQHKTGGVLNLQP